MCREAARRDLGEEWQADEDPTIFWIEKERLLLRRFDWFLRFRAFRAESTATYQPAIDVDINDDELAAGFPESNE